MQPGWEFKVNSINGRTWFVNSVTRQVQLWRPEIPKEEDVVDEEEDPDVVAQREAAAAAAQLLEFISALKVRQEDLGAGVTALQSKMDAQAKALKSKKGDALKAGQAQQQVLEKQIKEANQNLAAIQSQILDAQKKLPSSSRITAQATKPQGDSSVLSKKAISSGSSGKPVARANTMTSSKSTASTTSPAKISAASRHVPISRSSTDRKSVV